MKSKMSLMALVIAMTSFAGPGHHKLPPMPKEIEAMKGLVGQWEGTTLMDGKEVPATVSYALTSGNTVLMETLGAGTPHEMVSVYHKDGKGFGMTHYCALGNQPHMKLKSAKNGVFVFEMQGKDGIESLKEMHMHAVTLTLVDPNTLKQEWTNYNEGKKAQTAVFTFKKKS